MTFYIRLAVYFVIGFIVGVLLQEAVFAECAPESHVLYLELKEDINTPTPKGLEDAVIIVRTKSGKEYAMSANEYKVVPRVQQFVTKERDYNTVACIPNDKQEKNLVMWGVRKDFTGLSTEISSNEAKVRATKDIVIDMSYMREQVIDNIGFGIGVDTNGTPRAMVGVEF